jgi:AcrR family transcriptional regulator
VTPATAPAVRQLLPREERRASILRGAADAFARSGFAPTSMDDVAAACGVSRLIVYRHFDTKEDLYRAILQQVFDRLGEELEVGLTTGSTRGLGARTLLAVAREDEAAFRLLWRHAAHEPQFAAYAGELRSISVEVVRQLAVLDRGDEVLDRWMAEALFAWLVEATLTWLDVGDERRDDEWLDRATAGLRALRDSWSTAD